MTRSMFFPSADWIGSNVRRFSGRTAPHPCGNRRFCVHLAALCDVRLCRSGKLSVFLSCVYEKGYMAAAGELILCHGSI